MSNKPQRMENCKREAAHQVLSEVSFKGDRKQLDHWMRPIEKKVIDFFLPLVPSWIGTVELTLMTLVWSAGVVGFGFLAQNDVRWLWGFSLCIALQHLTDMLDGAVGRMRNTGLIKWGFYADHLFDYVFMCAIVLGYYFLLPENYSFLVLICLTLTGGLMAHAFLDFAITNEYKISYFRVGVSELRWLVIILNVFIIVFGKPLLIMLFPWITAGLLAVLVIVVYRSQKVYRFLDMKKLFSDKDD